MPVWLQVLLILPFQCCRIRFLSSTSFFCPPNSFFLRTRPQKRMLHKRSLVLTAIFLFPALLKLEYQKPLQIKIIKVCEFTWKRHHLYSLILLYQLKSAKNYKKWFIIFFPTTGLFFYFTFLVKFLPPKLSIAEIKQMCKEMMTV